MTERKPRYTDKQREDSFQDGQEKRASRIIKLEAVIANPDWYGEGVPEAAAKWLAFLKQEIKPSPDELEEMFIQFYPKIKNILESGQ